MYTLPNPLQHISGGYHDTRPQLQSLAWRKNKIMTTNDPLEIDITIQGLKLETLYRFKYTDAIRCDEGTGP